MVTKVCLTREKFNKTLFVLKKRGAQITALRKKNNLLKNENADILDHCKKPIVVRKSSNITAWFLGGVITGAGLFGLGLGIYLSVSPK